jgi:restriction system protein
MVHQLEEIEPNLKLVSRQLSTPAGRLDLLCQDKEGNYVVVELKRHLGTDQVVGQILRYMGWVMENYRTDSVRGIIVVAKKDPLLSYAVAAVPNIQTKTFRLSIS